ncbi:MAG: D-aminoacylase [Spirochaetia bacterium]|jgi:N-acyl-D-aspartate/D-glutamate deacylase|nr:D-aminoacylase [Spirochaetia bacterium]
MKKNNGTVTLLKGCTIADGTGRQAFVGDVALNGSEIAAVGKNLGTDGTVVDCAGLHLMPGFIDIHGHSDLKVLKDPSMTCKLQQGITTEVAGNCGVGTFPLCAESREVTLLDTRDVLGTYDYDWTDFASYASKVEEQGSGTNILYLQSHTALRTCVLHDDCNRPATKEEITSMCHLLDVSLSQGCIGLSSGLYYAPCVFAQRDELEALLRVVSSHGKLFAVHHRCEGDEVVSSLQEVLDLARSTGVRLEVSHLKAIGIKNQQYVPRLLTMLEEARREGIDVAFDQYPYDFGSTSLFSLLPPQYLRLSHDQLHMALGNREDRKRMSAMIMHPQGWDSLVELCGFDKIIPIVLEGQENYQYKTLRQIALEMKGSSTDEACMDAFLTLLENEQGVALMVDTTQSEESLCTIMRHPLMCFGTDALYASNLCHPRSYQAAIHMLQEYCLGQKVLGLEEMVHRMSGKTAQRLGLSDRGTIEAGKKADIVLLDLSRLKDNSTLTDPAARPDGVEKVFVNGRLAIEDGRLVASCPFGKILRML